MSKNDYTNKNNEKLKKIYVFEDLKDLKNILISNNKDEPDLYREIWKYLGDIIFKKEGINRAENAETSKIKIDITKNKYLENENTNLEINDKMSLEIIFEIIRNKEMKPLIKSYEYDYDNYLNEEEEPPVIKSLIYEIKSLEKIINSDKKAEKNISKKKMQLYLFLIYMIIKNYPLYIPKRSYLEKYYLELKKYKDWPDEIGIQGKKLYKLFINELYLPGITIFKEIRENYFLDSIDPRIFLLISDDFLRYYFFYDDKVNSSAYKFLTDDMSSDDLNLNAKEIFSPPSLTIIKKQKKQKNEEKSISKFNCLTIMHIIIFFCQQVLSHEEKVSLSIYQRICKQYSKYITDIITPESKQQTDDKKETINLESEKNIPRNTLNKSLLNSFFNILDVGIKTDYYKDFLPMINELEKKIMSSINSQDLLADNNYLNLRKYLIPKIEIAKSYNVSLISLYQYNYINIDDKYLSHLNNTIDYKGYDINKEDKKRVDIFNFIVGIKKNILEKYLKMRFIIHEELLLDFIEILIKNVQGLENRLLEREYQRKKLIEQEENEKEKEQKEKKLKLENEKKSKKKIIESQIENEKKKKEDEEKLKNMSYYELRKFLEGDPNNSDALKLIQQKESNALPEINNFLSSIILYILPNDNSAQHLSDYICRNNFIYQYIFYKNKENDSIRDIKLLKENLCIYLEEAKNYFELYVYKVILFSTENDENLKTRYFYSFIEVEVGSEPITINLLNNSEKPEQEKEIKKNPNIFQKIYIMNLIFKEKGKDDIFSGPSGTKYILNENTGHLTVICMKSDLNETNNNNYYGKLLSLQTNSEIYTCDEIKINGSLKVKGLIDLEENEIYQELVIGHATYDFENQEKIVKLKIAVF